MGLGKKFDPKERARYWCCKAYTENMVENWRDEIGDLLQLPYAYCIHDQDKVSTGEDRKEHVHIIVAWGNTTTGSAALKVFDRLSAPGKSCLQKNHEIEACINVVHAYNYLIHDTEDSRKKGKHQYLPEERITGNNFDIGAYETLSAHDKTDMALELCREIIEHKVVNFADFLTETMARHSGDVNYFEVIKTYSGLFDRTINGVYKKYYGNAKGCGEYGQSAQQEGTASDGTCSASE